MRMSFDDPQLCPHGNPLPGYEYVTTPWICLTQMQPGDEVIIRRIHEMAEADSKLMQYLEKNGVVPGVHAEVSEVLPFNQTITLRLGEQDVVLGFSAAQYVYIEEVGIEKTVIAVRHQL
jgi:DtxR family Mn-dependent transcriptional regulator